MRFFLLDVYRERNFRVSKDTNGGYGTVNDYGPGFFFADAKPYKKRRG